MSAANSAYQRANSSCAPNPRGATSRTLGKLRRMAHIGKSRLERGKIDSAPTCMDELIPDWEWRRNGTQWAPSQSHPVARIGSVVFPDVLPAVAQVKSATNASGNKVSATLRSACLKLTPRARATIELRVIPLFCAQNFAHKSRSLRWSLAHLHTGCF